MLLLLGLWWSLLPMGRRPPRPAGRRRHCAAAAELLKRRLLVMLLLLMLLLLIAACCFGGCCGVVIWGGSFSCERALVRSPTRRRRAADAANQKMGDLVHDDGDEGLLWAAAECRGLPRPRLRACGFAAAA